MPSRASLFDARGMRACSIANQRPNNVEYLWCKSEYIEETAHWNALLPISEPTIGCGNLLILLAINSKYSVTISGVCEKAAPFDNSWKVLLEKAANKHMSGKVKSCSLGTESWTHSAILNFGTYPLASVAMVEQILLPSQNSR